MTYSVEADLIASLPPGWHHRRLKEVSDVIPSNVDKLSVDGQAAVRLCNYVDTYKNERITASIDFMSATATQAQIERLSLKKGDITITKDSESPWDIAVPAFISEDVEGLVCGYHLSKIAPEAGVMDGGYLSWALRSKPVNLQFALAAQGITRYGLSSSALADGVVPCPPHHEQLAIAAYLDTETKRIDDLIREKEQLIGLLTELRGGVIRERTSGLNRAVARYETSNQFMPTLPIGWDLVGLGRYASITNGSTPLKDNAAFWVGGTYPWLNSAVVNVDEVTNASALVTADALRLCHLPIVPEGSVLVALTGQGKTRGQATVLRIEATINQHLAAIVCDVDHLDGEFLFWVLTGQYAALRMVSDGQGGTKGALTCDELGRFPIPKPPIGEQRAIAKSLYEETRKIDQLIVHVRKEVETLQELRSATITDAALGRIDVREYIKT